MANLSKGWETLIATLLHELRHVYVREKDREAAEKAKKEGKKPPTPRAGSGGGDGDHPMVPEHGMPEKNPDKDPGGTKTWDETDTREAKDTMAAAEKAAKKAGKTVPWKPKPAPSPDKEKGGEK